MDVQLKGGEGGGRLASAKGLGARLTSDEAPEPETRTLQQEKHQEEERAAVRVQAAARGKAGRQVTPPLKLSPCNRYRVNVAADNFGDCLCGWAKGEHSTGAFLSEIKKGKRVDSFELRSKMEKKEKQACDEYRIDMQAVNFGDCICGRPKIEHKELALTPMKASPRAMPVDEKELHAKFTHVTKTDCLRYQVNMNAANFGECVCGRPKAEHTDAALKGLVEDASSKVDEAELRRKMTAKAKTDCTEFRLDMNPSAPFGQCICGRPKKEHSDAALKKAEPSQPKAGFRKQDAEVRDKMIQRQTVSCAFYRLDMDPAAPFGQCVCGQPKNLHSADALAGKGPSPEKAPLPPAEEGAEASLDKAPLPPAELQLPASPESAVADADADADAESEP